MTITFSVGENTPDAVLAVTADWLSEAAEVIALTVQAVKRGEFDHVKEARAQVANLRTALQLYIEERNKVEKLRKQAAGAGVVSAPVSFPMRGATGLMGEAGPEAIMPLARGADGRLGVQASGGQRPVTVVMNIQTPDVQGFQRSQTQIAAQAQRMLARGQRNR